MANITVIPATIQKHTKLPANSKLKRKVAGYARVSTDSEEQQTSYEAQVDYYTRYIRSKADWEFVDVYTDEGISATNTNVKPCTRGKQKYFGKCNLGPKKEICRRKG